MATLKGSKSIKICQYNENLTIVNKWALFKGAVIEEFHCMSTYFIVYTKIISFLGIKYNQTVHIFPFGILVNSAYSIILFSTIIFQMM